MIDGLIGLLVVVLVVGIVYYVLTLVVNKLPIDDTFKQIFNLILILICVLVIVARALPLLGIHVL